MIWRAVLEPHNPEDEAQMLVRMEIVFKDSDRYENAAATIGEFITKAHLTGAEIQSIYPEWVE